MGSKPYSEYVLMKLYHVGNISEQYMQVLMKLYHTGNISVQDLRTFEDYIKIIYQSEMDKKFSKPMPWIGIYIAVASLLCTLAMVADLLHGLLNRKFWFPCKYFTLNAASLTVIAVAMKLPMDLSTSMPGIVEQSAKLGSMAFMCTMMANLMPSLATMNNNELLTNIIALDILVITLVVNVCIQIKTGVVAHLKDSALGYNLGIFRFVNGEYNMSIAIKYAAMLLFLLMILTSSALKIPTSKWILESKYQAGRRTTSNDQELQQLGQSTVEKLKQHVRKYWIMAETGSPQFVVACSPTSSASGVICAFTAIINVVIMVVTIVNIRKFGYINNSDYKGSMLPILMTQFIGVVLGTVAPLCRCFAALRFNFSVKLSRNHIKVFKVESYWTKKLFDWKQNHVPFPIGGRTSRILVHIVKNLILNACIAIQMANVILCKAVGLIPDFFVILVMCCSCCWQSLKAMFIASNNVLVTRLERRGTQKDLSDYVLQLQDEMELSDRTLKNILKSLNHLIQKAENQQPKNLIEFLKRSTGFEGVEKFDSDHVPPLLSEQPLDCWSMPVVTLTSIAIALPNIQSNRVDGLVSSVSEGLVYVNLVEENLNATDDYTNIQKEAKTLWLDIEFYHMWLGNKLQKLAHQGASSREILQWLSDTAENMVMEAKKKKVLRGLEEIEMSNSANSMYRITQTIMLSYSDRIDEISEGQLFEQISSMIADILAACLTNLPQVIEMKCYASAIERRQASVGTAAQLLGETKKILNNLEGRELPSLNPDEMAFIDKWCACLKHPIP